jgi:hypothetical protein
MANTYTWLITQIEYQPTAQGQTNFANKIYWTYSAADEGGKFTTESLGSTTLSHTPANEFIDANSLTHDMAMTWLEAELDNDTVTSLQSSLDAELTNLISTTV